MFPYLYLRQTLLKTIIFVFAVVDIFGPVPVKAQELRLPQPGAMLSLSAPINPPVLKGIKVHPENPLKFDFILDQGSQPPSPLQAEATQLIKYFLASVTIPEKDLWVNLSPYEKDRIVPYIFGQTTMGRDLLAQDYILKQITASLIYPEDPTGKKFWKRVYSEVAKKFGTTNIPVDTFNKVWIVPEKAVVYENPTGGAAYIVESKLKVMLEEDYKSTSIHRARAGLDAPGIMKQIVLPELAKEVNEGKNFAQLRQIYHSLILAAWYKRKIKESILAQVYEDKKKIGGLENVSSVDVEAIYQRYLQAFKKGAYNYIKDEIDPLTQQSFPRKYFSGGLNLFVSPAMIVSHDDAMLSQKASDVVVEAAIQPDATSQSIMDEPPAEVLAELFLANVATIDPDNKLIKMVHDGLTTEYLAVNALRNIIMALSFSRSTETLVRHDNRYVIKNLRRIFNLKRTLKENIPLTLEDLLRNHNILTEIVIKNLEEWQAPSYYTPKRLRGIYRNKTVLVTGVPGHLGMAIIKELLDTGAKRIVIATLHPEALAEILKYYPKRIVLVDGTLKTKNLMQAMKQYDVDGVIHLAGKVLTGESMLKPAEYFYVNFVGTLNVLEAMHQAGVKYFVFASSTMVYSGQEFNSKGLLEESMMPNPKNAYGATKRVVEIALRLIKLTLQQMGSDFHYSILRTFNVAGAFEWHFPDGTSRWYGPRPGIRQVVPVLVRTAMTPKVEGQPEPEFFIMGDQFKTQDGTAIRDFIHPLDMADAYIRSLARLFNGGDDHILNVGTHARSSVKKLLETTRRVTAKIIKTKIVDPRVGDPPDLGADDHLIISMGLRIENSAIANIIETQMKYEESEDPKQNVQAIETDMEEGDFMLKVLERLNRPGDPLVESDQLKFESLFSLFIYTLNPDFLKNSDAPRVIISMEKNIYQEAGKIQASPEGLMSAIDHEFIFHLRAYIDLMQGKGDANWFGRLSDSSKKIYRQRKAYIDEFLRLYASIPRRTPVLAGRFTPKQIQELVERLSKREQYGLEVLEELQKDFGLKRLELLMLIENLAENQKFRLNPVYKPENWSFLVPIFKSPEDAQPYAYKWYWAAVRDKDWIRVDNIFLVGPQGQLYVRKLKDGTLGTVHQETVKLGIVEAPSYEIKALLDILNSFRLKLDLKDLEAFPTTLKYDYDVDEKHPLAGRIDDQYPDYYFGQGSDETTWRGRLKEFNHIFVSFLDQHQVEEWKNQNGGHLPQDIEEIKLGDLINIPRTYFSPSLHAALKFPEFLQWLNEGLNRHAYPEWDRAQTSVPSPTGGIDLQRAFKDLRIKGDATIKFHMDRAQLHELTNASGFVPVVVRMTPLVDLRKFLGIP